MKKKQDPMWYRTWAARNPDKIQAARDRRYARVRQQREMVRDAYIAGLIAAGCRHIQGFDLFYVSPTGDVFSCLNRRGKKLKPGVKPGGYQFVALGRGNRSYKMIHRLVAETFIPNPLDRPAVNHIDGDKMNNVVDNLEWVTHKQNSDHAWRTGLMVNGPGRKLTASQVLRIRQDGRFYRDIGKTYGVCPQVICNIKLGRTYKDIQ